MAEAWPSRFNAWPKNYLCNIARYCLERFNQGREVDFGW